MARCLFVVEHTVEIRGRGLFLFPGHHSRGCRAFSHRRSNRPARPDGSAIDTQIDGLEFPCPNPRGELVLHLKGLTKEDVPVGTEIWSSDG